MSNRTLFPDPVDERDRPPDTGSNLGLAAEAGQETDIPPSGPPGVPFSRKGTSRKAAVNISPAAAPQAARVYAAILTAGSDGRTDSELQELLNLSGDSERPRRWSLERAGMIRDSGVRRKSPQNRDVIVWIAVEQEK